jgi:UDPglucose 6-dehydrogenase
VGYGGSCFPKDTKALRFLAKQFGYRLRTVDAAVEVNEAQKTVLFQKACRRLITFDRLKVAVLGVAFKAGTDDLREAPALDNVQLLLDAGANIHFFDPVAAAAFERRFPGRVISEKTPVDALKGANVCFAFTEWPQIRSLTPEDFKAHMRTPLVYDGRNLFNPHEMAEAGVEYHSIGRKSGSPAGK